MYQKFIQYLKANPFKCLIYILALLTIKEFIYTFTFQNKVSPIADGFSEANAIRGAVYFHDKGFKKTSGLPVLCYSNLLKGSGVETNGCSESAYTHYPPGPEYINWFWMHFFGRGSFNLNRYMHILISFLVGFFFLQTVFNFVGRGLRGFTLGLMLILPPMYSNYMHGLHYQQMAFLLLQLQIAIALFFVQRPSAKYLILFSVFGFFQGWLSFDYAFLATLFIIPFYFNFNKDYPIRFKHLIFAVLASGLSFTAAHALHFFQVINYLGGMEAALQDFLGSAAHRSYNAANSIDKPNAKYVDSEIGILTVAKDYLYRVAGRGKYLAINLMNFIWIILGLRMIKTLETKRFKFSFQVQTKDLLALLFSIFISSLWSIIMRQHAHIHGFIARHYYFCYFFCCLILTTRTSVLKKEYTGELSSITQNQTGKL